MSGTESLFRLLEVTAKTRFDGHLTIMRFTTGWRVAFCTPGSREDIQRMPDGPTFEEAAVQALTDVLVGEGSTRE